MATLPLGSDMSLGAPKRTMRTKCTNMFSAIELVKDKETREPLVPFGKDPEGIMPKIIGMLKADGFWTYSHENMFVVTPPLIITEEQLVEEMAKVDKVLDAVDAMI